MGYPQQLHDGVTQQTCGHTLAGGPLCVFTNRHTMAPFPIV